MTWQGNKIDTFKVSPSIESKGSNRKFADGNASISIFSTSHMHDKTHEIEMLIEKIIFFPYFAGFEGLFCSACVEICVEKRK